MKETAELGLECFLCTISFLMTGLSGTVADRTEDKQKGTAHNVSAFEFTGYVGVGEYAKSAKARPNGSLARYG